MLPKSASLISTSLPPMVLGLPLESEVLGRAASSADPTNCTSASGGESAPLALERMYTYAPTPIAASAATPTTTPAMSPADAASAPPLPSALCA